MEQASWIPAEEFCIHYHVELSLVKAIGEIGLVKINTKEDRVFIPAEGLADLERVVRLHEDLGINLEGIDVITLLLQRVHDLQAEVRTLKLRLQAYE